MRRVVVSCGCDKHIQTIDTDDGQKGMTKVEYLGLCPGCDANKGVYAITDRYQTRRKP